MQDDEAGKAPEDTLTRGDLGPPGAGDGHQGDQDQRVARVDHDAEGDAQAVTHEVDATERLMSADGRLGAEMGQLAGFIKLGMQPLKLWKKRINSCSRLMNLFG